MLIFVVFVHFSRKFSLIIRALMHQTTCTKGCIDKRTPNAFCIANNGKSVQHKSDSTQSIRHAQEEDLHAIPLYYAHIFVSLHALK